MTEQIQLPAIPDEQQLSKEFPSRPDWGRLNAAIEGVTGKALFDDHDFGPGSLEAIQRADAQVRDYDKVYSRQGGAYWDTPFGAVEKAGEAFAKVRTAEQGRVKDFRGRCSAIMGDYAKARTDAENEAKRLIEQQQRDSDVQAKMQRLKDLHEEITLISQYDDAGRTVEIEAEIEHVASTPIVPTVVTPQQAAAAANLPAMPKGLVSNKKPTYVRRIYHRLKVLVWMVAHPAYVEMCAEVQGEKLIINLTKISRSNIRIDGADLSEKHSIQNRGR